MIKRSLFAATTAALLSATPASAALEEGASVPSLITQGALAGKAFSFNLQQELRKGPVVLYFFPKAFTPGCSLEAKAFAERVNPHERPSGSYASCIGGRLTSLTC